MGALSVRENPFNNMNRKTKETSNQMQQEGKRGE